ncbi:putative colanic acid biosynthesis UDP-glucose lipid carrier transferase [Roseiarcus fermentans]|uniref:Putative colanic acid biosynthesis UDP-glucose lipid carrier transferase n=1 Tax=Roseiarcus fermentans TaxID=1473586 RepID=A0A366FRG9_9HYPH|nr:undecaprenyl-phosphate glucose phosphotransferase [Roseiarcus fermentans]RBP17141.1 putative colanic acid biosynthesis UDP-glucose lipid carrier transferase [Roseiarcus fermentans]
MTTDTEVAPETARGLSGGAPVGKPAQRRWRVPIAYRAIAPISLAIDLAIIVLSAISAELIYHNVPSEFEGEFSHTLAAAVFVAILFVAVIRIQKLYTPARLVVIDDQARSVLAAWCGAFFILASGVFTWGVGHDLSRGDILLFWAIGAVALLLHRVAWRAFLPQALESGALRGRKVVSMTCEDALPPRFVENLSRYGYLILAHFHVPAGESSSDDVIDSVISMCRTADIEEVLLFVDPERMAHLRPIARRLRVLPLPVTLVPFGTLAQLFQRTHSDIGDTVAIELQRAALSPVEQAVKRIIDIVISLSALVILAPLMTAVAIAIKLDSPGPVFFRQTRHGFNGRPFRMYKFRSMTVMENGDVVRQAEKNDKRVTRVGYWIRRLSIDELPQLINVFYGDMSIVGPRPHAAAHDRYFTSMIEKYAFRHHVKSGITGWAQVCGARGETDTLDKMQRRVELDLWYINNWSVLLDFSIMIRTIFVVFSAENAH